MSAAVKFTKKTLPQKEGLGEKLAKKRISLGLDYKDIDKAIRVRAKHIEAIENGRYDTLPPDVYVRGFVRSYANFLKLDPSKVMKLYERERGLIENVRKAKAGTPIVKTSGASQVIITPKTVTIGTIALAALSILFYIGWQVIILTAPPKLTITNPGDNVNIDGNAVSVEGKTDTGATLYINDVEVGIDQGGEFKENINLQSGVNIIKVRAQNKMGKYTEIKNTVVARYTNGVTPQGTESGVEVKLVIGPRSASVQIEVNGVKVTEKPIVMLAGVTQTYRATDKIKIITNDGGSVSATVDGQDIGKIGADNEAVNREFSKGMTITR
jgi:cytoskeletal protein RodZ